MIRESTRERLRRTAERLRRWRGDDRRSGRSEFDTTTSGEGDVTGEKLLAATLAFAVVLALVLASSPVAAVVTTLDGDEAVARDGTVTLEATIELEEGERIPIGGHLLTLTDDDGNSVELVFASDGTPLTTWSDSERIDVAVLEPTFEPTDATAAFGEGELVGFDEAMGEDRAFGYGYGYGYEAGEANEITYTIELDAEAFEEGTYDAHVAVVTDEVDETEELPSDERPSDTYETAFASNVHSFEVTDEVAEPGEPKEPAEPDGPLVDWQVYTFDDVTLVTIVFGDGTVVVIVAAEEVHVVVVEAGGR